jgi:hypothetical protein
MVIIPSDNAVNIDGYKVTGIDLSFIDPSFHAIQWYDTFGEIEIKDLVTGKILENREIFDITDIYNQVFPIWQEKKTAIENQLAEMQAKINEQNAIAQSTGK